MTTQPELQHSSQNTPLRERALQGAGIALVLATIFLSFLLPVGGVLVGKTFWEGVWQFLPIVTTAVGGTLGGIFYFIMVQVWYRTGWKKVLATIVSVLVYFALLWITLVAGFSATGQWD